MHAKVPHGIEQVKHEGQAPHAAGEVWEGRHAARGISNQLHGAVQERILKGAAAGQAARLSQLSLAALVLLRYRCMQDAMQDPAAVYYVDEQQVRSLCSSSAFFETFLTCNTGL